MTQPPLTRETLAQMIDHAVLTPDATIDELRQTCELCKRLQLKSLCVRPSDVALAAEWLADSPVLVGSVVAFPHGNTHTNTKAFEAAQAIRDGADELDMVLHIGRVRDNDFAYVRQDIAAVVQAAGGHCLKVILECAHLDPAEMAMACQAAEDAGADFVKTSTGFAAHGAKVEHVRLLREQVGDRLGVKAAGGIRTLSDARAMIDAGATRLGTSSSEAILAELDR